MADEIIDFERWAPGHAWGDAILADGTRLPLEDASGDEERRIKRLRAPATATQPAGNSPMAQAAAASGLTLRMNPAREADPFNPLAGNSLAMQAPQVGPPAPTRDQMLPPGAMNPSELPPLQRGTNAGPMSALGGRGTAPSGPGGDPMGEAARAAGGLQIIRHPGTRGGFQPSSRSDQVQGPAAEDRDSYLKQVDAANTARTEAGSSNLDADATSALREGMQAAVGRDEARGMIAKTQGKIAENERIRKATSDKMLSASKRPENYTALFSDSNGAFTAFAVLASMFGGLAQGASGGRIDNEGMNSVFALLDADVQGQRNDKESILNEYARQLGDLDAASSLLRADMSEALAKEAENMKRSDMAADVLSRIDAGKKLLLADAADKRSAAEAAVMRQVATQQTDRFVAGTPGGVSIGFAMGPVDAARFDAAGGQKALKELEAAKLGGEGSTTVGGAIADFQDVSNIENFLQAMAAANNGTIPTAGLIDFDRIDTLRNAGAKLGFKGKEDAARVVSKLQGLISRKARSYGGPITEADVANAVKEIGTNSATIFGTLEDMKRDYNNRISVKAGAHSLNGDGEVLLQQLLQRQGFAGGVPGAPSLRPR